MAIFWVLWMERNGTVVDDAKGEEMEHLLEKVLLASLLASTAECREHSVPTILLDKNAAVL